MLLQWNEGTGGGQGLDIYSQSYDIEKYDKYDVNLKDYGHTMISN